MGNDSSGAKASGLVRCAWAGSVVGPSDGPMADYHDRAWGVPVHDDRVLFEMLILEGAQAGLSWSTILNKREAYRAAFDGFDIGRVAAYGEGKFAELMANPGIVRNRLKIRSATKNAQAALKIIEERGSLDAYLWDFVGGVPVNPRFRTLADIPTSDALSDRISKDLKKRGMSFVGTTIIYAFVQAVGMVNAHTTDCFRWKEV